MVPKLAHNRVVVLHPVAEAKGQLGSVPVVIYFSDLWADNWPLRSLLTNMDALLTNTDYSRTYVN